PPCFTAGRTHEASTAEAKGGTAGVGFTWSHAGSAASRQALRKMRRLVGGAPGGAGPYVTGAARSGRRARWLARDARAGPFRKGLAKGASQAVHQNRINLLIPGTCRTLPGKLNGYLPGAPALGREQGVRGGRARSEALR